MTGEKTPGRGTGRLEPNGRPIRFSGVSKRFDAPGKGQMIAINAVDLDIPAHQFVAIIGPSGCGKSTLLRLADGLIAPDRGQVTIGGEPAGSLSVAIPKVRCTDAVRARVKDLLTRSAALLEIA